ncbi:MAG: bifunctional UDP-3-O-[3-hydroxymyristoyl] N-acetylglucosamine deacetylase/3-hydroxyacyl-ACP dehydratase [Bacteroidia bacterium]|nr:bifunctional UDP-3-O-[3-hydroxymyristoyl] N-acetylglucosamine deacetylase/3-hydroxyacyl-ACP dehydratase [Bacteroidia bacterium]MCX7763576.1 bifunctional UDP-3-O-[3-hydroxymyristoyl] N-acetylglucosamine deacetylase/3-hydroxyacyl-ACP dehydratase [Bacteroidia bacterium]MDW8058189.1 bifunctional UDP-3-O-[3-hydroxymyristoyl] N-acetylglucosamine deacetylase/3-hydroxyacyl-ACP dehydratase [Bacteroidia bacterium]
MFQKQHTLRDTVSFEGVGLHTGESVRVQVHPAPENSGYVFVRMDLPSPVEIPARVEYVVDLMRSTTLGKGNARVHTVEHLLAALMGMGVSNARIEVWGPEIPILDGSALPFVEAIQQVGLQPQKEPQQFYHIEEPVHYQNKERGVDIAAFPFEGFRATVIVDYNSQVLGIQPATLVRWEDFAKDIAPARTFCLLYELEELHRLGLIRGGTLENAIVIVDRVYSPEELQRIGALFGYPDVQVVEQGVLNNTPLRFDNEPARHKLLDLIGDLALLGAPLRGQIMAMRPGHAANIEFIRTLYKLIQKRQIIQRFQKTPTSGGVVFDIHAIRQILPHRYPFLLVDRITHFSEDSIVGIKNVTINEPFFAGHFEDNPIMPGVLILEAMAQVGGILFLNIVENPQDYWVYFLAIDGARFKKPVVPGDQLVFKLDMLQLRRGICKMAGKAYVDDKLVCEAELTASLVPKSSLKVTHAAKASSREHQS